jgi:4-amino-4-deoxy-L-arabinose transferase-like glycosyltransferase
MKTVLPGLYDEQGQHMTHWKNNVIVMLMLGLFFAQSYSSLMTKSSTWDETHYFGIGRYLLKHQTWDVMGSILHPPLSFYITSIPLLFVPFEEKLWERGKEGDINFLGGVDVVRGQSILSSPQNQNDTFLIASRLMITLLAVLLGYYVYRFSSSLYGEKCGLLSLVLFSFCPNMLAFSGIAGPDMPLTVFSFISIYYWWIALQNQSIKNSLLAGLFLGAALLTKFTALILLPVFIILSVKLMLKDKKVFYRNIFPVLSVAVLILLCGYGFQIKPYLQGISFQLARSSIGQDSFLMGEYSRFGWWYYYFVAFFLKTPIPTIILFMVAMVSYCRAPKKQFVDGVFLLLPISAFFLLFCIKHQSIGLRYILPVYPFIFVFIGAVPAIGNKIKYPVIILLLWQMISSFHVFPHYLAYFNEIIGGPGNGYKYLVDSNLDWGQDLKGLKKFMDKNGIDRISLSYFGTDSPQRYGIKYDWLPSDVLYNPDPGASLQRPAGQLIAISATNLQGMTLEDKNQFKWLQKHKPLAKIGYSIFVYDIEREQR